MNYTVQVKVMPLADLLDPQGKAVLGSLKHLEISGVEDVRIGKHITLSIDAATAGEASAKADEISQKLLANPVMEYYEITVQ